MARPQRSRASDNAEAAFQRATSIVAIARSKGRKSLDLSGLLNLEQLPEEISALDLTRFQARETKIKDIGLLAGQVNLRFVDLGDSQVSDIAPLSGLTKLSQLSLHGTRVRNLRPLSSLNNLRTLFLGNTPVVDLRPIEHLRKLTGLYAHNTKAHSLRNILGLKNLRQLTLSNTKIQNEELAYIPSSVNRLTLDGAPISDISALHRLSNLEDLEVYGTQVEDIAVLGLLKRLERISIADTQVADISALSRLENLAYLDVSRSRARDLSPLARSHSLYEAAGGFHAGLEFSAENSSNPEIRALSTTEQPEKTRGTINALRRAAGLPDFEPIDDDDDDDHVDQEGLRRGLEALVQAPTGAIFVEEHDRFVFDGLATASDEKVASERTTILLHEEVQRKALVFEAAALRLDNQPGWAGVGTAARRFRELVQRSTSEIPHSLATLYSVSLELGSFYEMNAQLTTTDSTEKLAPEVRRPFADLMLTAAPWVRRFPSARHLDDETGAFLARADLFGPAIRVMERAAAKTLVSVEDAKLIAALVHSGERRNFPGEKGGVRGIQSARNLAIAAASLVGTFYLGAVASYVAPKSAIVAKAGDFIISGETEIGALFADAPADLAAAIREMFARLRAGQPTILPEEAKVRLRAPPKRRAPN